MFLSAALTLSAVGCATGPSGHVVTAESLEATYDELRLSGDSLQDKECVLKAANALVLEDATDSFQAVGPTVKTSASNPMDGSAIATRSGEVGLQLTPEYYVKVASATCKEAAEENVGS